MPREPQRSTTSTTGLFHCCRARRLHRQALPASAACEFECGLDTTDNSVRKEEFQFSCANVLCRDQCATCAGKVFAGLTPDRQMSNHPHLRPLVSILDAILLPRLQVELRRVFQQVANFRRLRIVCHPRHLFRAASTCVRFVGDDCRFLRPHTRIARNFRHETLFSFVQSIQKVSVATVSFIECPIRHVHAVAERPIDQINGDLRLRLKRDVLRNVFFFRRAESSAQSLGRYRRLSSNV